MSIIDIEKDWDPSQIKGKQCTQRRFSPLPAGVVSFVALQLDTVQMYGVGCPIKATRLVPRHQEGVERG